MVRVKSRWLLVRIDHEEHVKNLPQTLVRVRGKVSGAPTMDKKDFYHTLRIMIEDAFGIAASGITDDIHGMSCLQFL